MQDQSAIARSQPIPRGQVLFPLRALTDDTRLQILELLAASETLRAQAIIEELDVTQSTVSRHLSQLVAAGFIAEERGDGANKSYRLRRERVEEVFALLSQLLSAENAQAVLSDARRKLPQNLHRFLDREGLLIHWPRTPSDQKNLLDYLVEKFQPNHLYSETEVNDLLNRWHTFDDPAILRREMVDYGYMGRTSSGDRYWREK